MRPETLAIRTQTERTGEKEHSTPLFLTSSFVYDSAEDMAAAFSDDSLDVNIYSRFSNPSVDEFIKKVCLMEGAEDGIATASGMAAVNACFMTFLSAGDHVISAAAVFGSTHAILTKYLPKWGIEYSYFDMNKPESIEALVKSNTKLLYVETPSNPGLDIIDMEMVAAICKKHNIIFVVDNCFATPAVQQPILFGADLVLHSATKFMDGQGRVLGGVVVGKKELVKEMYLYIRNTGPSLSAFNAWILSKSLETLYVRMDKHAQNALQIAKALENHPALNWVKYPFLPSHPRYDIAVKQMSNGGGILTFELKAGLEGGRKFIDGLQLHSHVANIGDARSLAIHPASTTHSQLTAEERDSAGVTDDYVRLSVGIEDIEDIIADLEQALAKA